MKPVKEVKKSKNDFKGKTNEELQEILKNLASELQRYQTMAIKAQGAMEVIQQLLEGKNES